MQNPGIPAPSLSGSDRFQAIIEPMKPWFAELDRFLHSQVDSFEPEVQPLARYCFGHSGKKLRPLLVFSMALDRAGQPREDLLKAAAIVELVHLATLVHDDILDGADLRHRTETIVARHGSHVAVLLGDALFAHALHLASTYPEVEICRVVSLATRQVCSGEIAQTFARGDAVPTASGYFRMIDLKTAELFAASAYLGGYLSGFSGDALNSASRFARHLGIAYQIYDDAADIFAEEAVAGKTLGTDLATGKFTLPVLLWLDSLGEKARRQTLADLKNGENGRLDIRKILRETGVLESVQEAFSGQLDRARDALSRIPGQRSRHHLEELTDFVESAWNKFSIR